MGVGYFTKDTAPKNFCHSHVLVDYDTDAGGVVDLSADKEYNSLSENKNKLKKVALVKELSRDFPIQLYITDAEYVYRPITKPILQKSWNEPFFADTIKKGRYVGITYHNDGKQFNAFCFEHKKREDEEYEDTTSNDNTEDNADSTKKTENTESETEAFE